MTTSVLALATAAQAQDSGAARAAGDEEIVVIGSAARAAEDVNNRRQALGVVDTLTQDDTGDLADETLADALIRVPGVSSMQTLYGEQEAAYVSVRGISPDLNFTSFDGMAMFSSANDGDGLRRVDLNLIPTQISRTTQIFKTFTSDLDAGAIGGVTNIVPRSALNDKDTFYIDAFVSLQTGYGKYVPGDNSRGSYSDTPWGGGVKGLWARKFGGEGQFGVVLSGVYRQRAYDYTKRNPNGRVFYQPNGAAANANLSNWDGLHPLPTLIRPMDYTHFTRTFGGSAQLEYEPAPGLQLSLLGYEYKQLEDQTLNQFYVEQYTGLVRTGPETARLKIGRTRPSYSYDRFENETRGFIFKTVKEFDSNAVLEARAGWNMNRFHDTDLTAIYAYSPPSSFINYDMSELSDRITIDNYDPLINTANYRLSAASDLFVDAKMTSVEGKLDYRNNFGRGNNGFGFAVGIDARKVEATRNQAQTTYVNNSSAMGDIGFVPDGFLPWMYDMPVLWIDYAKFEANVKPNLAINQATTNNAAWSGDYTYKERILAGYASVTYATDTFNAVAGFRYDDVDYEASSPLAVGGRYAGAFQQYDGGYRHLLPSILLSQQLGDNFRVKAGYSRTLGRPAFEQIARAETRDDDELVISRGNPDLKPRRSDNFDLAAEYYFAGSGLIALSGFVKNIKDDIYTMRGADLVIGGVTYEVTQPMNALSSKMKGIEFQIVSSEIPGLPGFLKNKLGVSANVTRMWANMDYLSGTTEVHLDALQYQADWLANASLFYRLPGNGEVRLAYNWKSKSPISLGAYSWTTYWLEARGQLDAAFRYALGDNIIVKLQANNILQDPIAQGYYDVPYEMRRYEMTRNRSFQLDLIFKM
ncbi:TonB-dependent receptor [Sphingomonas sp. M1-B02]|uniref:TonB-dependent receptor n=1 Tax=Sphingomonas sp. M1-B02 TaxID=3114300 RepID=UPI00223EA435|nr:TonB-dependent receptor [Sphingomonas sp. S6-11]UZK67044.1 TonB-dependent receptor [Sphingomonas sp. S6-11]